MLSVGMMSLRGPAVMPTVNGTAAVQSLHEREPAAISPLPVLLTFSLVK